MGSPNVELEDEELAVRYQGGDECALEVLVSRYRWQFHRKARSYFIMGGDAEDLEQECLIGLYKAARDFRTEHQRSFRGFAEMCVMRQVISAIKAAARRKHQPLNRYVPLVWPSPGDDPDRGADEIADRDPGADPAERMVSIETVGEMRERVRDSLSRLEVDVLRLHVDGRSYQEIGAELGCHVKSIDNALQRVKRKLDPHLRPKS